MAKKEAPTPKKNRAKKPTPEPSPEPTAPVAEPALVTSSPSSAAPDPAEPAGATAPDEVRFNLRLPRKIADYYDRQARAHCCPTGPYMSIILVNHAEAERRGQGDEFLDV